MGYISPLTVQVKGHKEVMIRTAEGSDGKAMYELTKEVILEERGLIMTINDFLLTVEDQANRNELFLQHPQTVAIIAEHKNKFLGILTIEPDHLFKTAHRGHLGIIIQRDYRSLGIGKILVNTAIHWATNNIYYEKIELEVLESNKPAISLYEKLGFIHEGRIERAVKHNENQYDHLLKMGLLVY